MQSGKGVGLSGLYNKMEKVKMTNYFEQERIRMEELANTTADQLIICLCIDSSYSMVQNNRIQHVNNSIKKFIKTISENIYAKDTVDLAIVSFGNRGVQVLQEFSHVDKINYSDITPSGGTPLGEAIEKCILLIDSEIEKWSEYGVGMYKPWLIIMSDDGADDDTSKAVEIVRKRLEERKIKTKCIGLGEGSERGDLAKFSLDGRVDSFAAMEIDNFFDMLSKSAAGLSVSSPEDDITDFI